MESWEIELTTLLESEFKTHIISFNIDLDFSKRASSVTIEHDGTCDPKNYSYTDVNGQLFLFIPNDTDLIKKVSQIVTNEIVEKGVRKASILKGSEILTRL